MDVRIALVVGFVVMWIIKVATQPRSNLPPGPRPLPLVGNLFSIQFPHFYLSIQRFHRLYGPMVHVKLGGSNIILLGNQKIAFDLLDRRGTIYSSRPPLPFFDRYVSQGNHWAFLPATPHWKAARRLATRKLVGIKHGSSEAIQEIEACLAVINISKQPDTWMKEVERLTASTMSSLCYGQPLRDLQHPIFKDLLQINKDLLLALVPAGNWMDLLPILEYLPDALAPWRKRGLAIRDRELKFHVGLLQEVSHQGESAPPSWAKDYLSGEEGDTLKAFKDPRVGLAFVIAEMFLAGHTTTASAMQSFVLACLTYPTFRQRAQRELDAVVGSERLPTFADRPNLPFIDAIARETLRWRPPIPTNLPHATIKDDVYEAPDGNAYFIARGTQIIASAWTLSHDDAVWDEPAGFMPERHLVAQGKLKPDPEYAAFGHGLRVCPGAALAERSLFIFIATMLWAFDIEPLVDGSGAPSVYTAEVQKSYLCDSGLRPSPFLCRFVMRPGKGEVCAREAEVRKDNVPHLMANTY